MIDKKIVLLKVPKYSLQNLTHLTTKINSNVCFHVKFRNLKNRAETEIEQNNIFLTGTATHDGTAIAQAVVQHLKNKIHCRTMFVTHFKSIIGDINAHMGFLSEEEVLFLYKVNIRQLDFFMKTEFL